MLLRFSPEPEPEALLRFSPEAEVLLRFSPEELLDEDVRSFSLLPPLFESRSPPLDRGVLLEEPFGEPLRDPELDFLPLSAALSSESIMLLPPLPRLLAPAFGLSAFLAFGTSSKLAELPRPDDALCLSTLPESRAYTSIWSSERRIVRVRSCFSM